MSLLDIYLRAKHGPWITSGLNVQWRLEIDGNAGRLIFMYTNDGEDGKHDWLHNFEFWPRYVRRGFAHNGISRMLESALPDIDLALDNAKINTLEISGISQGGALAVGAFDSISRRFPALWVTAYAFAPPPYWHRFALFPEVLDLARKSLKTIYVRGDIVALSTLIFGYRHVGQIIKLGSPCLPCIKKHTFEAYEDALKDLAAGAES